MKLVGATACVEHDEEASMAIIEPHDPIRLLAADPVITTEPATSLAELASMFELELVGAVAVMTGPRLDGMISERDVVRAVAADGNPGDVWAADVMTETPIGVDADASIAQAAERMLDEGVRHLPVMAGADLVGIVSMRDVLRVFTDSWRRTHHQS
jgi:CBS domain-containing protein